MSEPSSRQSCSWPHPKGNEKKKETRKKEGTRYFFYRPVGIKGIELEEKDTLKRGEYSLNEIEGEKKPSFYFIEKKRP